MNLRVLCLPLLVCAVALPGAGCSGVTDPSKNKNDDITDVIGPDSAVIRQDYEFTVAKNGEFSVTITALSNPNAVIGVYVGLINGFGTCSPALGTNNLAVLNRVALTGSINKGSGYCLSVFDNGSLTADVTFTVRLSHP
jgi:hypothetical protein